MSLLSIRLDIAQAQMALRQLDAQHKQVLGSIALGWNAVGKAAMLAGAGIVAMGASAAIAFKSVAELNKNLINAAAIGGISTESMLGLKDAVIDVATEFGVSKNTISAGIVELTKAGLTAEEVSQSLRVLTQVTRANGLAFDESAKLGVFAVKSFGREFSDLRELMDKAQVATQRSILDFGDLQKTFAFAGQSAQLARLSYEQLLAVMSTLSNRALEAGISARSVNRMILDLVEGAPEIQKWADSMNLGIQVVQDGAIAFDDIVAAFSKMDMSLDDIIKSSEIFEVRSLRAWAALLAGAQDYQENLVAIQGASGELEKVSAMQLTSLSAILDRIKESFLAAFTRDDFVDKLTVALNKLDVAVGDLGPKLADLVSTLLTDFVTILPDLIAFLESIVGIMVDWLPILSSLAKIAAKLPAEFVIWVVLLKGISGAMFLQLKLLPMLIANYNSYGIALGKNALDLETNAFLTEFMTVKEMALGVQLQITALKWQIYQQSVMGALGGFLLLFTVENKLLKFLAAITIGVNAAAVAFTFLASAEAAASLGLTRGQQVGAALAVGAGIAAGSAIVSSQVNLADTGAIATRHQSIYVEPGEEIVSRTMRTVRGSTGGNHFHFHDSIITSREQAADMLTEAMRTANNRGSY